eukprot:scaffold182533_cov34-Prasinocladus_malaysianus.AAC.1
MPTALTYDRRLRSRINIVGAIAKHATTTQKVSGWRKLAHDMRGRCEGCGTMAARASPARMRNSHPTMKSSTYRTTYTNEATATAEGHIESLRASMVPIDILPTI